MGVGLVLLKAATSIAAMAMCLSPIPSVYRIHQNKDTGEVAVLPLVALWISCHMWMVYGYVTNDIFPLLVTYLVGELLALCYITVHFRYTKFRAYTAKAMAFAASFVALGTAYAVLGREGVTDQSLKSVGNVMGYITAGGSFLLYTSPFETIKRVLQTKSGASIPIALCTASTVSNSLWVVYGLVVNDMFVFGLGVFCVALPLFQIVLYLVYNPRHQNSRQNGLSIALSEVYSSSAAHKDFSIVVVTPGAADMSVPELAGAANFEAISSPLPLAVSVAGRDSVPATPTQ